MGYTHYWYRDKVLDKDGWALLMQDFPKVVEGLKEIGVPLASWDGHGEPEIAGNVIAFNGVEKCGHPKRDLGIPWPAEEAMGVFNGDGDKEDIGGTWFAGAKLKRRACGGDCSHETFRLERVYQPRGSYDAAHENGKYFSFCKTAYKPYDVAVCACLILAKAYLKEQIIVSSDGEPATWGDVAQGMTIGLGKEAIEMTWDKDGHLANVEIIEKA